jgi:hypothetical protein
MATNDPFAKYAVPEDKDPFAQYAVPSEKEEQKDPFEQYAEKPAEKIEVASEKGFWQTQMDKPILGARDTTDEELLEIANRNKVDYAELKKLAPYFGARQNGDFFTTDEVKRGVGMIGSEVLLNLPQKAFKKTQSPEMERALDELQELTNSKASQLQTVAGIAAPGAALKKVGPVVTATATGAAAGLGSSDQGKELENTAIGTGLGLGLGVLGKSAVKYLTGSEKQLLDLPDGGKKASQIAESGEILEKQVPKSAEIPTKEGGISAIPTSKEDLFGTLLQKEMDSGKKFTPEELTEAGLSSKEYNRMKKEVAGFFATGDTDKVSSNTQAIRDAYFQMTGKNRVKDTVDVFYELKKAKGDKPVVADIPGIIGEKIDYVSAATPLAAKISGEIGRPVDLHLGRLSKGLTAAKELVNSFNPTILKLKTFAEDFGKISPERLHELDTFMQGKDVTKIGELLKPLNATDKEIQTLQKVHELYLDAEKTAVSRGSNLKTLRPENPITKPESVYYSPRQALDYPELLAKADKYLKETPVDWKDVQKIADGYENNIPEYQEVIKVLELATGKPITDDFGRFKPEVYKEAAAIWDKGFEAVVQNRQNRSRTEAAAIKQRFNLIPDFLQEKDPIRKASKYLNGLFKHTEIEPILAKLSQDREWAKQKGNTSAVNALDGWIQAALSTDQGSFAGRLATRKELTKANIEKNLLTGSANAKRLANLQQSAGGTIGFLGGQMYKNLLASPKSALINVFQTLAQTVPEIGYLNGSVVWGKALKNYLVDFGTGGPKNIRKKLVQWEDLPYNQDRAMEAIIRNGLEKNTGLMQVLNKVPGGIEALTDMSMVLWKQADIFNKYMVNSMGDEMSKMMLKNPDRFKFFLKTMSPGYRDATKVALAAKDQKQVSDLLQTYLSTKTVFNYDRPSMSAFARDLGPMFGAFTRFPTEAIGDASYIASRKDLTGLEKARYVGNKYAGSLALGATANAILFKSLSGPGKASEEDTTKDVKGRALLGQQGFLAPAFATSLLNVASEGYTPSPLLTVPYAIAKTPVAIGTLLMSDDDEEEQKAKKALAKVAGDALSTFGPGAGLTLLVNDSFKIQEALRKGELPEEGLGASKSLIKQMVEKRMGVEK